MTYMHEQGDLPIPGIAHIEQPYWYANGGDLSPRIRPESRARGGSQNPRAGRREYRERLFLESRFRRLWRHFIPPSTYWPEIQRICDQYGILLVADEVICGFGRTGGMVWQPILWHPPAPDDHRQGLVLGLSADWRRAGARPGGLLVLIEPSISTTALPIPPPGGRRRGGREPAHPEKRTHHQAHARRDGAVCPSAVRCKTPLPIIRWWMMCAAWTRAPFLCPLTLVDDKASCKRFDNGDALALRNAATSALPII